MLGCGAPTDLQDDQINSLPPFRSRTGLDFHGFPERTLPCRAMLCCAVLCCDVVVHSNEIVAFPPSLGSRRNANGA